MGRIVSFALTLLLSGCIVIPFIQAFKETGATPADRMALLEPQAKKFSDAVVMGNKMSALKFVMPETRSEVAKQIKSKSDEERVVESKMDDVEWIDDATKATVTVKIKYYKIPYYIVESRIEQQHWEFSMSEGWQLRDMSIVEG